MSTRKTKKKIEFYVSPARWADLDKMRKDKGWTMAELMRRAVDRLSER